MIFAPYVLICMVMIVPQADSRYVAEEANTISHDKTVTPEECREKCDTMYSIQCPYATESYIKYFICVKGKETCKNRCLVNIETANLKDTIKKLKRKLKTSRHH